MQQRSAFFCLRISLGVICSLAEAKFYRAVADHLNERVARYMLVGMMASAGMWNAGTGGRLWHATTVERTDTIE